MGQVGRQRHSTTKTTAAAAMDAVSRVNRFCTVSTSARQQNRAPQIDGIIDALVMIDDATSVLLQVRQDLKLLAEPAIAASAEPDLANRALFADEYDERRDGLKDHVVGPQDAAATLLSEDGREVSVPVDGTLSYRVGRFPMNFGPEGLGLPAPVGAFEEPTEIVAVLRAIEHAVERIDRATSRYAQDKAFLRRKLAELDDSMLPSS